MKVLIWVKKEDVISNNITMYFTNRPHGDGQYLQVILSQLEFVELDDSLSSFRL